jgi:capsule polysaccharide export protein KpsC/LpsZ
LVDSTLKHYSFFDNLVERKGIFYGWGRKKFGLKAIRLAKKYDLKKLLSVSI